MTSLHPTSRLFSALAAALVWSLAASAPGHSAEPDGTLAPIAEPGAAVAQAFDAALQAYERCHWSLAFEQLVRLADQGHADAARMASEMHKYGPALYAQAFVLSLPQRERFARLRPLGPLAAAQD